MTQKNEKYYEKIEHQLRTINSTLESLASTSNINHSEIAYKYNDDSSVLNIDCILIDDTAATRKIFDILTLMPITNKNQPIQMQNQIQSVTNNNANNNNFPQNEI